jgi:uncharacterized protein YodC (DUF2158 family)
MKTGDVVYLKPYNCNATVRELHGNSVECDWFEGNQLHREKIKLEDVKPIHPVD